MQQRNRKYNKYTAEELRKNMDHAILDSYSYSQGIIPKDSPHVLTVKRLAKIISILDPGMPNNNNCSPRYIYLNHHFRYFINARADQLLQDENNLFFLIVFLL